MLASDLNSSHIVAKWIENYPGKPPERTRGQLSREIKNLLGQGYPWELVNRAVAEWSRSGLAPSQLSSFLDQLQRGVGYGVRRIGSRNDQMFIEAQETRELARQLDAADRGELA